MSSRFLKKLCIRYNLHMKDVSNQVFGRLTAIKPTGEKRWGVHLWLCQCECGAQKVAAVNSLRSGLVRSCGCLHSDTARATKLKHGEYGSRTYKSWDSMIQRCKNKNSTSYGRYGALGISVCERWIDFQTFFADMGECPEGLSLDRIDPYGNYEPENCRWASDIVQARNKKKPITTFEQAEVIRKLHSIGVGRREIAKTVGVSFGSVNGVVYLGQISKAS